MGFGKRILEGGAYIGNQIRSAPKKVMKSYKKYNSPEEQERRLVAEENRLAHQERIEERRSKIRKLQGGQSGGLFGGGGFGGGGLDVFGGGGFGGGGNAMGAMSPTLNMGAMGLGGNVSKQPRRRYSSRPRRRTVVRYVYERRRR